MGASDVLCLSHVPWTLALERPHQVMRRLAQGCRVFFVEDPVVARGRPRAQIRAVSDDVHVVSVRVPNDFDEQDSYEHHRRMVEILVRRMGIERPVLWTYSPAAFEAGLASAPLLVVYDCIEDPPYGAIGRERDLLARADVVFTASDALFEAKRGGNVSTYPVPNGVDAEHFRAGRRARPPSDQNALPRPRAGVLGAIDERVDLDLVDRLAVARPDLEIVLVGPLVRTSRRELPSRPNVRWLGAKSYEDLPAYVAGWDVGLVPWKASASARRVEPPSILPCLAAGVPVVATPIDAIAERFGGSGPVEVAPADSFAEAVDAALDANAARSAEIDALLARTSWDRTAKVVSCLVAEAALARELAQQKRRPA